MRKASTFLKTYFRKHSIFEKKCLPEYFIRSTKTWQKKCPAWLLNRNNNREKFRTDRHVRGGNIIESFDDSGAIEPWTKWFFSQNEPVLSIYLLLFMHGYLSCLYYAVLLCSPVDPVWYLWCMVAYTCNVIPCASGIIHITARDSTW